MAFSPQAFPAQNQESSFGYISKIDDEIDIV